MSDEFKMYTRNTTLTVVLETYGTVEQADKSLERLMKEIKLQGFKAEVTKVSSEIVDKPVEDVEISDFGKDITFDERIGYGASPTYAYYAQVVGLGMELVHISNRKLIDPKVYLRNEGPYWFLDLVEPSDWCSDPRGFIHSRTVKEV